MFSHLVHIDTEKFPFFHLKLDTRKFVFKKTHNNEPSYHSRVHSITDDSNKQQVEAPKHLFFWE